MTAWDVVVLLCLAGLVVLLACRANSRRLLCPACLTVVVVSDAPPGPRWPVSCPHCGERLREVIRA